jgi:hypothetical protein
MTNEVENAQWRESRPLNVERGVRERDRIDQSSLGQRRERAAAIRRDRGKEVV